MFNADFYPTPLAVIESILADVSIKGKIVLEPSAGKGDIVEYLLQNGAKKVYFCEIEPKLATITATKANFLKDDFLKVSREEISAVDLIVMNPPFSADEKHIIHAWEIMPEGCQLVALCNSETLKNKWSRSRQVLSNIVGTYGFSIELGDVFKRSERSTNVSVSVVKVIKPKTGGDDEFSDYFDLTDTDYDDQSEGIIKYNELRDCVSRYVGAIKLYDNVLDNGVQMRGLISKFDPYSKLTFTLTDSERPKNRETFKIELQKSAWSYIFKLMKMEKYLTQNAISEINKFVETQQKIPFTLKNIYKMLEVIVGTNTSRMDKSILEVFDSFTKYYEDNRAGYEGWKTNSYYILNRKFILPGVVDVDFSGNMRTSYNSRNLSHLDDLNKILCYLTATNYEQIGSFQSNFWRKSSYKNEETKTFKFGQPYEWGFFKFVGYKKGSIHMTFLDEKVWAKFNQNVARLKGYPLPQTGKTSYQPKNYTEAEKNAKNKATNTKPASKPAQTITTKTGASIKHNTITNKIEIVFSDKIPLSLKSDLVNWGFDYFASKNIWYSDYTSQLYAEIKSNIK